MQAFLLVCVAFLARADTCMGYSNTSFALCESLGCELNSEKDTCTFKGATLTAINCMIKAADESVCIESDCPYVDWATGDYLKYFNLSGGLEGACVPIIKKLPLCSAATTRKLCEGEALYSYNLGTFLGGAGLGAKNLCEWDTSDSEPVCRQKDFETVCPKATGTSDMTCGLGCIFKTGYGCVPDMCGALTRAGCTNEAVENFPLIPGCTWKNTLEGCVIGSGSNPNPPANCDDFTKTQCNANNDCVWTKVTYVGEELELCMNKSECKEGPDKELCESVDACVWKEGKCEYNNSGGSDIDPESNVDCDDYNYSKTTCNVHDKCAWSRVAVGPYTKDENEEMCFQKADCAFGPRDNCEIVGPCVWNGEKCVYNSGAQKRDPVSLSALLFTAFSLVGLAISF